MPNATHNAGRVPPERAKAILENFVVALMRRAGMDVVVRQKSSRRYRLDITLPDPQETEHG